MLFLISDIINIIDKFFEGCDSMNILVVGNGFDLAHGLPTRYSDFLNFIKEFKSYFSYNVPKELISFNFLDILEKLNSVYKNFKDEIINLIKDNNWIEYFDDLSEDGNWVDFEQEISNVVKFLESLYKEASEKDINAIESPISLCAVFDEFKLYYIKRFFKNIEKYTFDVSYYYEMAGIYAINIDNIIKISNFLLKDLDRLIRCLEIYLELISEEYLTEENKIRGIKELNIERVISFNYTNTFEKLYDINKNVEYDFIHGKAKLDNNVNTSNIILGIDEYLPDDEKDKNLTFVKFKKFYQRIYKKTGCLYNSWLKEHSKIIKKLFPNYNGDDYFDDLGLEPINIYIFGHSLDITDKDILNTLIMNKFSKVTIFYHNKDELSKKIINTIKIIGQDNLIEFVHGANPKLKFVNQNTLL